jgi:hypothetical protein
MDICTLVLEYSRAPKSRDVGSVWIYAGDGIASLARPEPIEELEGWTRVAGPLPYEAASEIHAALKAFFEKSGVRVIDQGIAD